MSGGMSGNLSGIVAVAMSVILLSIAGLHVYWAFGGKWPGSSERDLVNAVAGIGDKMPPPFACLVVAMVLALMAVIPLIASGILDDRPLAVVGLEGALPWLLASAAGIFLLRGLVTFAARLFPKIIEGRHPKFVTLDRRFYGPLCLILGAAYLGFYLVLS